MAKKERMKKTAVFRKEVYFSGRVQGVGFRATALDAARGFEVTGRVENLPDGRVRLVAEGEQTEAEAFVAEVHRQMASYIRSSEAEIFTGERRFNDFQIERFY